MRKFHPTVKTETLTQTDNRALFLACALVFALVFYAMFLFWEDEINDSSTHVSTDYKATTQVVHSQRSELRVEADQQFSSDSHRDTMSPAADQQVAVNFLLHQLQTGEQGIAVVGVSPHGLSGSLGLRDGDHITEVNGQAVRSVDEVQSLLQGYHPKQILQFKVKRDGLAMRWTYQAQADD